MAVAIRGRDPGRGGPQVERRARRFPARLKRPIRVGLNRRRDAAWLGCHSASPARISTGACARRSARPIPIDIHLFLPGRQSAAAETFWRRLEERRRTVQALAAIEPCRSGSPARVADAEQVAGHRHQARDQEHAADLADDDERGVASERVADRMALRGMEPRRERLPDVACSPAVTSRKSWDEASGHGAASRMGSGGGGPACPPGADRGWPDCGRMRGGDGSPAGTCDAAASWRQGRV